MPTIKGFAQYSEHEVINLYAFSGTTPTNKGTFVRILGSGWRSDVDPSSMIGAAGKAYGNTVAQRYAVNAKVGVAAILNQSSTIYILILAAIFLKEPFTRRKLVASLVALAGIENVGIGETVADADEPHALPVIRVEAPTVRMTFGVNNSPFTGREGTWEHNGAGDARGARPDRAPASSVDAHGAGQAEQNHLP